MKKILVIGVVLSLCSMSLNAQESMKKKDEKASKEMESKGMAFTGYLVDKMCGTGMVKGDAAKAADKGMKHTKACALDEDCAASGFGLVMDGKYVKFDESGDKLALEYLNKSEKKNGFLVEVSGMKDGDKIKVKSIAEGKVEMKKEMSK
jgi:hypothetical protein